MDETPPRLVTAVPESGAVDLREVHVLEFGFSEKMTRDDAIRWLNTFPRLDIRRTRWHGARVAEVQLQDFLPPDTVVVIEVGVGMRDAHSVPRVERRRFPVATASAIPAGEIAGGLIFEDQPLVGGVVELYAIPPETLRYFQQPILRRVETDSAGSFRFPWLSVPGGPYLLRAFQDANGDLRLAESEAQRLLPDTVSVTADQPRRLLDLVTLYSTTTPGQLRGRLDTRPALAGSVRAFTLRIAEDDTGWVPEPQVQPAPNLTAVPDSGEVVVPDAGPGLVREIFFVDADGDSLLSVLPVLEEAVVETVLVERALGDTTVVDTMTVGFLEPWAMVDSLAVEPGLESVAPAPVWPDTLTRWLTPMARALPDSLPAATADTLGIVDGDSSRTEEP